MTLAPGNATVSYSVVAVLHGSNRSTLLSLASALHRRRVDVVIAKLTRPAAECVTFEATILTTPGQARTVEATLRNLVHVTEVCVTEICVTEIRAGVECRSTVT